MLKFLGVSRSGYRAFLNRKVSPSKQRKDAVKKDIRKIYDNSKQNYGAPKITRELRKSGETIAQRTVGKYMREMGLKAQWVRPWTLSDTMEVSSVIETINKAKAVRNTDLPLIIHSDRGSQYVSNAWREATQKMQRSYSHSGYPYDNACIESFHSLIKREWLNRFNIQNQKHAYRLVFEYIETFYNTVRIHSHCDYMSPNEFEALYERVNSLSIA